MTNKNEDPFEKMGNDYLFQDSEEDFSTEPKTKKPGQKRKSNRNFWIAAAIMTGVFLLLVGLLVIITMSALPKIQAARLEQAALINAHNTATVQAATASVIALAQAATETATSAIEASPTAEPEIVLFSDTPVPEVTETAPADNAALTATASALVTEETEAPAEETEAATEEATDLSTEETEAPTEEAAAQTTETAVVIFTEIATTEPAVNATTVSTAEPAANTTAAAAELTATSTELPQTGFADNIGMPGLFGLALALILVIALSRKVRLSN